MSAGGLSLSDDPDLPLVWHAQGSEAQFVSRGAVREEADRLISQMTARGVTRALVRSDDPAVLLRAIDGCSRAGVDLFIAHTNLPGAMVEQLADEEGIGVVLGDLAVWREGASAPARGCIYMMTSGTTGRPKIASHTLNGLLSRVRATASLPVNRGGSWLLTYQATGFAGLQVALTACQAHGVIVAPAQRNPAAFYEAARLSRATHISGTATFWRAFLMVAKPGELSLRQITLGGEAADQSTLDRLKAMFPEARITHTYASTEAGVVYAVHDGREGFPAAWLETPPSPAVRLRIVDGFLQIMSPNTMQGYLGRTAQPLLSDGWLATADRVEIVGDRVRVIGRDDSTINVGGSKVYPLKVETFLLGLPGVAEARVFGLPNPISGFLVAADIVPLAGAEPGQLRRDLMAACRDGLAAYEVPRQLKIVDQIAVLSSGKKG